MASISNVMKIFLAIDGGEKKANTFVPDKFFTLV